ncbi:MAG: hypothetical protein IPK22_29085 [Verrucomicrobiaceae bacterium]|nr:hypothetical protein [Verrucomicrobiaceae bacterium]
MRIEHIADNTTFTKTDQEAIALLSRLAPAWIEEMPMAAANRGSEGRSCKRRKEYFPETNEGIVAWYLGAGFPPEETGWRVLHIFDVDALSFMIKTISAIPAIEGRESP